MNKIFFFLLVPFLFFGQKQNTIDKYLAKTNSAELAEFIRNAEQENLNRQDRINSYLESNPSVRRSFFVGEDFKEIYDIDSNGNPIYNATFNFNAGITVRATDLYNGGSLGLNVEGQDMLVGVWDGGSSRASHVEFGGRIFIMDNSGTSNHGTHVTGTVIASGNNNPLSRGIAPKANIRSYNWTNDISEMSIAYQLFGLLVSNHSYGPDADSSPMWLFGGYNNSARTLDQLIHTTQYFLPVYAAGNDRDNFVNLNPTKGGYDLIGSFNSAKNIITVGAVNQVLNYTSSSSVVMSAFSNWGPTDDGRIKPDVVAKGTQVLSTTSTSDVSYGELQGTSMASPAVAGVGILLQQHFINLYEEPMLASTLKGLILHTADECGFFAGPDYRFGWGLVNASRGAQVISGRNTNSVVNEIDLINSSSYTTTVNVVDNSQPLMVSLSWTDVAPTSINNGTVDLPTLMLVNDLDVRVTKDGETFFPWTLTPAIPQAPALNTEDNFRDNFEKIEILDPSVGQYTITVTHKGNLVGGNQMFSLIATGGLDQTLSSDSVTKDDFVIWPNPVTSNLNFSNTNNTIIDSVKIYDFTGKVLKFLNYQNSVDVSGLSNGIYFIELVSGDKTYVKKFVKK